MCYTSILEIVVCASWLNSDFAILLKLESQKFCPNWWMQLCVDIAIFLLKAKLDCVVIRASTVIFFCFYSS